MPQGIGLQLPGALTALEELVAKRKLEQLQAEARAEELRRFNLEENRRESQERRTQQLFERTLSSLPTQPKGVILDPEQVLLSETGQEIARGLQTGGFTLGPEQTRFGPTGQELARGTSKGFTLGPEQIYFDPTGQELARGAPEAFTLGKNQIRFGSTGQELARGIPEESITPYQQAVLAEQRANRLSREERFETTRQDKLALKEFEIKKAQKTVSDFAEETLSVLDQLMTPQGTLQPGVSGIIGRARVPQILTGVPGVREIAGKFSGGDIANKQVAIERLHNLMVVDLIAAMKAQSDTGATGMGQLNREELRLLKSASAQLQQVQTEPQFLDILLQIRQKLQKVLSTPDSPEAPTEEVPPDLTYDPRTRRAR